MDPATSSADDPSTETADGTHSGGRLIRVGGLVGALPLGLIARFAVTAYAERRLNGGAPISNGPDPEGNRTGPAGRVRRIVRAGPRGPVAP